MFGIKGIEAVQFGSCLKRQLMVAWAVLRSATRAWTSRPRAPSEPGGDYVLKITSGLPNGCAKFNGHEVQRDGDGFMVTVTNLMPHPSVAIACTEIYGFHEGEVVLGSGLVAGDVYTASVNDDREIFFTA